MNSPKTNWPRHESDTSAGLQSSYNEGMLCVDHAPGDRMIIKWQRDAPYNTAGLQPRHDERMRSIDHTMRDRMIIKWRSHDP